MISSNIMEFTVVDNLLKKSVFFNNPTEKSKGYWRLDNQCTYITSNNCCLDNFLKYLLIKNCLSVDLFVEDKTSHQGPIALRVRPSMTVLQLKQKMEREYEIPPKVQRWILGRKLANDDQATLESMGIDTPGTPIFMYLVAPGK